MRKTIQAFLVCAALAPMAAQAQGIAGGEARGAEEGGHALGAPGAVVGGAVGGVVGGVAGLLGVDQRPRFREYVVQEHRPSYRWDQRVVVGAVLPPTGVEYYEVPDQYGVRGYRYAVVNDQIVLVDPRTHRIVQIIEG
ncbi:MAG TPA: DUF1236 domain-containing protein [Rhodoblastus sp.]|nr:DUF1236 domain-containing protein [Rhodoblastus sp.]